jgi:hypothetical protein
MGYYLMHEDTPLTKGERRERRKKNARKMGVDGRSNILLWQLTTERARKARKQAELRNKRRRHGRRS